MSEVTHQRRYRQLSLGAALIGIVVMGLVFTIWRQTVQVESLTAWKRQLQDETASRESHLLQVAARKRAEADIAAWYAELQSKKPVQPQPTKPTTPVQRSRPPDAKTRIEIINLKQRIADLELEILGGPPAPPLPPPDPSEDQP